MIEINNNDNRTTAQNLFDSPFSLMLTLYYMRSVNSNYTRTIEHTLDLGTAEAISRIIYLYTLILSYSSRSLCHVILASMTFISSCSRRLLPEGLRAALFSISLPCLICKSPTLMLMYTVNMIPLCRGATKRGIVLLYWKLKKSCCTCLSKIVL